MWNRALTQLWHRLSRQNAIPILDGVFTIEFDKYFTDVSVVEGSGTVNGIPLEKGQHFIVPAGYGKCRFEGVMSLICSNPEKH